MIFVSNQMVINYFIFSIINMIFSAINNFAAKFATIIDNSEHVSYILLHITLHIFKIPYHHHRNVVIIMHILHEVLLFKCHVTNMCGFDNQTQQINIWRTSTAMTIFRFSRYTNTITITGFTTN